MSLHSLWNNSRSLYDCRAVARIREGVVFSASGSLKVRLSNAESRTLNTEHRMEKLPAEGLEPTRPCGHWILSPARLPVPPRRLLEERDDTVSAQKLKSSDEKSTPDGALFAALLAQQLRGLAKAGADGSGKVLLLA